MCKLYLIHIHRRCRGVCISSMDICSSLTFHVCPQILDRKYTVQMCNGIISKQLTLKAAIWKPTCSTKRSDSVLQFRDPQGVSFNSCQVCLIRAKAYRFSVLKLKTTAGCIALVSLMQSQETCEFQETKSQPSK